MSEREQETMRPGEKIIEGLEEAIAIVERAKWIDPKAWGDVDHEAMRTRRFAAIHQASRELAAAAVVKLERKK